VIQDSARAAGRALILQRWTVVRATTAAFTRYGRCGRLRTLELNSRRSSGDGVGLTHRVRPSQRALALSVGGREGLLVCGSAGF